MNTIEDILYTHKLRKTPTRLHVLQQFVGNRSAMSAHDLEKALKDVDRITLYRTLRVFESRGIIHKAHDGTQTVKYALCSEQCTDAVHVDDHVHFHCEICGNTVCLDKVQTPALDMPEGYHLTSLQIVAHGKCKNCIIA